MFSGGLDSSQSRQETAMPDVTEKKVANMEIPQKFRADIETLQELFGVQFTAGFTIDWTLQQVLEILPRERKRVDSYGQLLMGMDGRFNPPVMWELVKPFAASRYHIPLSEFVYAYVESVKALGGSEIIGLQIESSRTELKLKIRV